MDAKHYFDFEQYFAAICSKSKLATEHGFIFSTCSGIESLQGPLQDYRTGSAFFCVDDTNDGSLYRSRTGGWYKRRTLTVFLLHRYEFDDMALRSQALALCRELYRQVATRMIVDARNMNNELVHLHVESMLCRELGRYFMNGCTGLYFMVDVDEPVDLRFNKAEWTD